MTLQRLIPFLLLLFSFLPPLLSWCRCRIFAGPSLPRAMPCLAMNKPRPPCGSRGTSGGKERREEGREGGQEKERLSAIARP